MNPIIINNFLSIEECESILNYSLCNLELKRGQVKIDDEFKVDLHRESNITFDQYLQFPYLMDRIHTLVSDTIKIKGFNIDFDNKKFQFTEYKSGDYYDWHTDILDDSINRRFYSIVIRLNDNYTGGELELKDYKSIKSNTGTLYMFPSDMNHRVTIITSGIRYSLVMWLNLTPIKSYSKSLI
jgi:PKHD-type hydroxylase